MHGSRRTTRQLRDLTRRGEKPKTNRERRSDLQRDWDRKRKDRPTRWGSRRSESAVANTSTATVVPAILTVTPSSGAKPINADNMKTPEWKSVSSQKPISFSNIINLIRPATEIHASSVIGRAKKARVNGLHCFFFSLFTSVLPPIPIGVLHVIV